LNPAGSSDGVKTGAGAGGCNGVGASDLDSLAGVELSTDFDAVSLGELLDCHVLLVVDPAEVVC
jgi:hypothetical protein